MTTTRQEFAQGLRANKIEGMRPELNAWVARHNAALDHWVITTTNGNRPRAASDRNGNERAILDLAYAIGQWAEAHDPTTDYVASEIVEGLLVQFSTALDYDCGRLEAGRGILSAWAYDLATRYELDPWGEGVER